MPLSGRGSFSAAATVTATNDQNAESAVLNDAANLAGLCESVEDSIELRKIKKVQSFFRGWLCRRRWKQIVEEYIKSPHAESMRKRNSLVFSMVEAEEEYLEQLEVKKRNFLFVDKTVLGLQKLLIVGNLQRLPRENRKSSLSALFFRANVNT